jgi:hypothetical protein
LFFRSFRSETNETARNRQQLFLRLRSNANQRENSSISTMTSLQKQHMKNEWQGKTCEVCKINKATKELASMGKFRIVCSTSCQLTPVLDYIRSCKINPEAYKQNRSSSSSSSQQART